MVAVLVIAAVIGILFATGVLGKPSVVGTWTGMLDLTQEMGVIRSEAHSFAYYDGFDEMVKTIPAVPVTVTFLENGTYTATADFSGIVSWAKSNAETVVPFVYSAVTGENLTLEEIQAETGMSADQIIDFAVSWYIPHIEVPMTETGTYMLNGETLSMTGRADFNGSTYKTSAFGTVSRKEINLQYKIDYTVSVILTRSK